MNVDRQREGRVRRYSVGRVSDVIVPVGMRRTAPVSMRVSMPGGKRHTAGRQVERIVIPRVRVRVGVIVRTRALVCIAARNRMQLAPCANRDPGAEPDERNAGDRIAEVTEALRGARADDPYRHAKQECGRHMSRAGSTELTASITTSRLSAIARSASVSATM